MRVDDFDLDAGPGKVMVLVLDQRVLAVMMLAEIAGRAPPAQWTVDQVLDDCEKNTPELANMVRRCSEAALDYFRHQMAQAEPEGLQ